MRHGMEFAAKLSPVLRVLIRLHSAVPAFGHLGNSKVLATARFQTFLSKEAH